MVQVGDDLKGDLWQVLAHAFANTLIAVGFVLALVGVAAYLIYFRRRWLLAAVVIGAGLMIAAAIIHLIAWR